MRKFYSPKFIILILALFSFGIVIKHSVSNAGGPPVGYTGAPGESNCTSCHSGSVNSGAYNNSVVITSNMPNGRYALNTTYQITVKAATKNCVKYGFETIALNSSNTMAGNFAATNTRAQKVTSGAKQYMSQSSSGTSSLYTDSTEWTFNWTSPTSNVGTVTFYLALNVTNNNNNDNNDTVYVKSFTFPPYTPPQAGIGTSSVNICEGDSVRFTASGTNSPTGFNWTFPGGIPSTSTSQIQYVKFPNAGTALCSLVVTNSSGSSPLVTRAITINSYPTASISATGSTTFCAGDSVLLTGNTGNGYSYLWFLNGVTTGNTNSQIYAKTSGAYTYKVTNAGVCSVTSSAINVTVNPNPAITFTSNGALKFCTGDSVRLQVSGAAGATVEWFDGTTPLTGITDTIYYAKTSGDYNVKVTNATQCVKTAGPISVTVNTYPTASFTSVPSGCIFILTANTGTNYRYQWYKNDTAMVNDTNISHTLNASGTYKVRVTNSSGCAVFSAPQTINVANLPDVTLTVGGNTTFCTGDSCTLSVPANAAYKYQWFKNGNTLTNDTLNRIVLKDSGIYLVKVSNNTCTNISGSRLIKVLDYPDASINSNNTSFCAGDSALISAKPVTGFLYKWYKNDTLITGESNPTLRIKSAGNYRLNVSNGVCNTNGGTINIKVNPLPSVPVISRDKQTLTSTVAVAYQWIKEGVDISGAQARSYTPVADGKYKVRVIDSNGCTNTSAEYNYALTGIAKASSRINDINIYPSPANEQLHIELGNTENTSMRIIDAQGKEIYHVSAAETKTTLQVNQWSEGIYMAVFETNGNYKVVKFVIAR